MSHFSRRSLLKGAALPVVGTFALPTLAAAIQTNSTPQQRPKLKITDVRTAQVNVHGPQTHIRIYTDQGIWGKGNRPMLPSVRRRWCVAGVACLWVKTQ